MPVYLRKSYNFGPLRVNLSKSGVGLSVGVPGLRAGIGPRGAHIHAGRHGLYFRQQVGWRALEQASVETDVDGSPEFQLYKFSVDLNEAIEGARGFLAFLVDIEERTTDAETKEFMQSMVARFEAAQTRVENASAALRGKLEQVPGEGGSGSRGSNIWLLAGILLVLALCAIGVGVLALYWIQRGI